MAIVITFKTDRTFKAGSYVYEQKTGQWSEPVSFGPIEITGPEPQAGEAAVSSPPPSSPPPPAGPSANGSGRHLSASAETTGGKFGRYLEKPVDPVIVRPSPPKPEQPPEDESAVRKHMTPDQRIEFNNRVLLAVKDSEGKGRGCTTRMIFDCLADLEKRPASMPGFIGRLDTIAKEGFLIKEPIPGSGREAPHGFFYIWKLTDRGRAAEQMVRETHDTPSAKEQSRGSALRNLMSPRPAWKNILHTARGAAQSDADVTFVTHLTEIVEEVGENSFTPNNGDMERIRRLLGRDQELH